MHKHIALARPSRHCQAILFVLYRTIHRRQTLAPRARDIKKSTSDSDSPSPPHTQPVDDNYSEVSMVEHCFVKDMCPYGAASNIVGARTHARFLAAEVSNRARPGTRYRIDRAMYMFPHSWVTVLSRCEYVSDSVTRFQNSWCEISSSMVESSSMMIVQQFPERR